MRFKKKGFAGPQRAWAFLIPALALALILGAPGLSQGRDLRLAWDGNTETDLAGYKVYYGSGSGQYGTVVDVGNRTAYLISGLDDTRAYYVSVTAYSTAGLESAFSNEITSAATGVLIPPDSPSDTTTPTTPGTPAGTPPSSPSSSDSAGGGGGCFIATAAYGSYLAPEVKLLRHFRDRRLLTNRPGVLFVKCYYRYSPPVADFISRHEGLRALTRWLLSPMVYGIKYPIAALIFLLGLAIPVYMFRARRRTEAAGRRVPLPAPCERSTR